MGKQMRQNGTLRSGTAAVVTLYIEGEKKKATQVWRRKWSEDIVTTVTASAGAGGLIQIL